VSSIGRLPRLISTGTFDTTLTCYGCGTSVSGADGPAFKCPKASELPSVDHVLMPATSVKVNAISEMVRKFDAKVDTTGNVSPFVKYRALLYPYRVAMSLGWGDSEYVDLVTKLDEEIEKLDGVGFRETPLHWNEDLNAFVKVESNQVAQSHKARHLFNVMTYLLILEKSRPTLKTDCRLAVASCGNAGLAAATIARAARWPIDVCIPEDASPAVVEKLQYLNADIRVCPRGAPSVSTSFGQVSTEGAADPTVAVFKNLVEHHGSIPFSVQGSECGLAAEGGQTLAWEILDAAMRQGKELDFENIYVQVGGGALGAGLAQGFSRAVSGELGEVVEGLQMEKSPSLMCVQAEGNAPLHRAYQKMKESKCTPAEAKSRRPEFMYAWENPTSIASGILDDETYDWVQLAEGLHNTGGDVVLVNDEAVVKAKEVAEQVFNVNACHTGSAGLASLITRQEGSSSSRRPSIAILSGLDRSQPSAAAQAE